MDKTAKVALGKQVKVSSCYNCPFYQKSELKDWEFCHYAGKDLTLRIGQNFPIWCPLETAQ
jgi:hypothetical protein